MRTWRYIIGVVSLILGLALLVPAAALLNQGLHLVPTSWGIFDIQIGGREISNSFAKIVLGTVGVVLLCIGSVLIGKRSSGAK
jgi:hypothetical protein